MPGEPGPSRFSLPFCGRIVPFVITCDRNRFALLDEIEYYDIVLIMIRSTLCAIFVTAAIPGSNDSAIARPTHSEQAFTIHLNGSVAAVAPLFGPVRESEWAPEWHPQFRYPLLPGQLAGAVFITKTHNGQERIWLLTTYDEKEGRIKYVTIVPGITASEIDVQILPDGMNKTVATITYRHTALTDDGITEVEKLGPTWAEQQHDHWQTAINDALSRTARK
jgi:hypothetical protein